MAELSSIKTSVDAKVTGLIPMAFVADVQRSIDFYKLLGMEVRNCLKSGSGTGSGNVQWAHVACERADLMFARATEPVVPSQQAVLFYLYSPNLVMLPEHLISAGIHVPAIIYPDCMPKGEARVEDPDGYTLLIGQAG
jgi:catechol 2,3-dioxygenase-like lactoylglutathione lyase family enzyme